jgi:homoserine dehydrogenase
VAKETDDEAMGVGLLGLGGVGSGVATYLTSRASSPPGGGAALALRRILVRDLKKPRTFQPPTGLLTDDANTVLCDRRIGIIVEVMGGEHPALEHIQQALSHGKHVVTANKEVVAKHGPELLALAARNQVQLRFEASVGGGIPIIGPLQHDLRANEISSIRAIINGTTNYILTRMDQAGLDFDSALKEALELGYAESDPNNDVQGIDAAYKLAILATLAFRTRVRISDIYHEGITDLQARDFRYARELGYSIKLLAIARLVDGGVHARVHPAMLPLETPLAKVDGAFNAVEVQGDLVGSVVFSGQGAGTWPTTSAIIADVLEIARRTGRGDRQTPGDGAPEAQSFWQDRQLVIRPMASLVTRYYLRLNVLDRSHVLAQIATVLGDHGISLASVIQKDADPQQGTAEIVITTHPASEAALQQARIELQRLDVVKELNSLVRIDAG